MKRSTCALCVGWMGAPAICYDGGPVGRKNGTLDVGSTAVPQATRMLSERPLIVPGIFRRIRDPGC